VIFRIAFVLWTVFALAAGLTIAASFALDLARALAP
jgi:hypothetical protein